MERLQAGVQEEFRVWAPKQVGVPQCSENEKKPYLCIDETEALRGRSHWSKWSRSTEIPIMVKDTIKLLGSIAKERKMKAAVKRYGMGHVLAGALIGFLTFGLTGASVGAFAVPWMLSGKFRPVSEILSELPPAEQEKLFSKATQIICRRGMRNDAVKKELLAMLETYLTEQLQAKIHYDD